MPNDRPSALAELKRMIGWIALIGVLRAAGALWYLSLYGPLRVPMVGATVAGVFFSVLLGCGLFAAAFCSGKSGHDENVRDATTRDDD